MPVTSLITTLAQASTGLCAAVLVPWNLRTTSLQRLTASESSVSDGKSIRPAPVVALRTARRTITYLVRLRVPGYRNTCLYRSVADCVVLRWYGHAAVLRIGVRAEAGKEQTASTIAAHAWVDSPAVLPDDSAEPFEVLHSTVSHRSR